MFLYAGGCSMTFGSEIMGPDDNLVEADPVLNAERIRKAWPGVLADMLGCDGHHNAGVGGASNEMILRTTMMWIMQEWLEKGRNPDDLFVVINWSQPTRWEFYHDGKFDAIFAHHEPFENRPRKLRRLWARFREEGCGDYHMSWRKYLMQIIQLQSFLHNRGIKYAMAHGLMSPKRVLIENLHPDNGMEVVVDFLRTISVVDKKRFYRFLDPDSGMCQVLYQHGITGDRLAPKGHPYEDGHLIWAQTLKEWIDRANLLESI